MSRMADQLIASWSSRGLLPILLLPLAALMGVLVWLRRQAYARGWLTSASPGLPVLVIGNRIVGGAGKTPATIAIIRHLQDQGWRPGILSRGYRRNSSQAQELTLIDQHTASTLAAGDIGDEPALLWRRTQAPMMIGRDRVAAGRALKESHPDINILVCDDGLQHLALQREIEVVVFDERGAGNGWLLPAGPLREPIAPKAPAALVSPPIVLYNANAPSTPLPGHTARRHLSRMQPLQQWWSSHADTPPPRQAEPPRTDVWAVAGIAHPPKFFDQLRQQGFDIHPVPCADHASYETELPWPPEARHVIVTEKDAVKLPPERVARLRPQTQVWVSALDLQPDTSFWQELDAALACLPRPPHITY